LAKIAGLKLCESFNRQYGVGYVTVMPANLYGPGDHYDLNDSHVLPALLRKAHEAKECGGTHLDVWGSGRPRRELLYVDDLAEACVFLMERPDIRDGVFNVGTSQDICIAELAERICQTVGFVGKLRFDSAQPDGTTRKLLDVRRMTALGWLASTSLNDGLAKTYNDFLKNVASNDIHH
jgi:GDP-L-fucose synthase